MKLFVPNRLGTTGLDKMARIWICADWANALHECIMEGRHWRTLL